MVVIDATILALLLQPNAKGPLDKNKNPVTRARERVEYLVSQLEKTGTKLCIPAPALSEALIKIGPREALRAVETIRKQSIFEVKPFDELAAIELANIQREEMGKRRPKEGPETWAKLKFDRQIVAIARVWAAEIIYSDDEDIDKLGKRIGIPVVGVADLPLNPDEKQGDLFRESEDGTDSNA